MEFSQPQIHYEVVDGGVVKVVCVVLAFVEVVARRFVQENSQWRGFGQYCRLLVDNEQQRAFWREA